MAEENELNQLSFSVSGRVSKPVEVVFEAVANPDQLSKYFTTGGAQGRMETGAEVSWDFADFSNRFPVYVKTAEPPKLLEFQWGPEDHVTCVKFTFEPVDGNTRTLVTISEGDWKPTASEAKWAFGSCEGWTGMLAALRVWLDFGIVLREGYYK